MRTRQEYATTPGFTRIFRRVLYSVMLNTKNEKDCGFYQVTVMSLYLCNCLTEKFRTCAGMDLAFSSMKNIEDTFSSFLVN
jgi:hypothetical protein